MGGADGAGEVAVGAVELSSDAAAAEDAVIEGHGLAMVFGALEVEWERHRLRRVAENRGKRSVERVNGG